MAIHVVAQQPTQAHSVKPTWPVQVGHAEMLEHAQTSQGLSMAVSVLQPGQENFVSFHTPAAAHHVRIEGSVSTMERNFSVSVSPGSQVHSVKPYNPVPVVPVTEAPVSMWVTSMFVHVSQGLQA